MNDDITNALNILHEGGIILYPTDTIWGLGCDATNESAVHRIYSIKKREDTKSMIILVESANRLFQYVKEIPEVTWQILDAAINPLTIIYPGAKNLAKNLIADDNSIGIRIVNNEFCEKLIQRFKKPVVSTSANISGEPSPKNFGQIKDIIKEQVDYVVKWHQNDLSEKKPSGIIKLGIGGEIKIIRE